jgi:hypothetical protein
VFSRTCEIAEKSHEQNARSGHFAHVSGAKP